MMSSLRTLAGLIVLAGCASHPPRPEPKVSDCCADLGIDVNLVLGPKAVNCGKINSKADSDAVRSKNLEVVACVRRAQSRHVAHVVEYGLTVSPDFYTRSVVVFGAHGEKIQVAIQHERNDPTYFIVACAKLEILDSGDLENSGCQTDDPLLQRIRLPGASAPER